MSDKQKLLEELRQRALKSVTQSKQKDEEEKQSDKPEGETNQSNNETNDQENQVNSEKNLIGKPDKGIEDGEIVGSEKEEGELSRDSDGNDVESDSSDVPVRRDERDGGKERRGYQSGSHGGRGGRDTYDRRRRSNGSRRVYTSPSNRSDGYERANGSNNNGGFNSPPMSNHNQQHFTPPPVYNHNGNFASPLPVNSPPFMNPFYGMNQNMGIPNLMGNQLNMEPNYQQQQMNQNQNDIMYNPYLLYSLLSSQLGNIPASPQNQNNSYQPPIDQTNSSRSSAKRYRDEEDFDFPVQPRKKKVTHQDIENAKQEYEKHQKSHEADLLKLEQLSKRLGSVESGISQVEILRHTVETRIRIHQENLRVAKKENDEIIKTMNALYDKKNSLLLEREKIETKLKALEPTLEAESGNLMRLEIRYNIEQKKDFTG
eukprot:TRINITY_DN1750_c0_g1_i1.p1 TRINITY_DN1750_c0_g1~~TRINITY_DN1750_c0_g1_i1.p1  ORF type:complete len:442 (-),score=89.40 TRINITY_DN1750_c0_g1_i1:65-1351(-)